MFFFLISSVNGESNDRENNDVLRRCGVLKNRFILGRVFFLFELFVCLLVNIY